MLFYITCVMLLYNIKYVMLYNICLLSYLTNVMLCDITCYITYVMLCDMTCVMLSYVT